MGNLILKFFSWEVLFVPLYFFSSRPALLVVVQKVVFLCLNIQYWCLCMWLQRTQLLLNPHILYCPHSDGGKSKSWLGTEGSPQREDPQQRLRWQAHLEFTHNHTVGDLTWDLIDPVLPRSERLRSLVLGGIPHSMRPQVSRLAQHGELCVSWLEVGLIGLKYWPGWLVNQVNK